MTELKKGTILQNRVNNHEYIVTAVDIRKTSVTVKSLTGTDEKMLSLKNLQNFVNLGISKDTLIGKTSKRGVSSQVQNRRNNGRKSTKK